MTFHRPGLRSWLLSALMVVPVGIGHGEAWAVPIKHRAQQVVPVYVQQAPAAVSYSAPTVTQYSAPAVTQYLAPAPTYYSAPAAVTYSAPAAVTYSAPVGTTYSAPAGVTYSAPAASLGGGLAVGNAPVAGARISAVDRSDIIGELRKESRENGTDGTSRERRKSLRESARTKYAEAISGTRGEDYELNDSENQDIEIVVNSILDANVGGQAMAGYPGYAPAMSTGYAPSYTTTTTTTTYAAPAYAQPQPVMIVQPVVPVQLYVPVQPKHHFFHK